MPGAEGKACLPINWRSGKPISAAWAARPKSAGNACLAHAQGGNP